jgi:pimeloyl-ACP methyl ester carboxylesterase
MQGGCFRHVTPFFPTGIGVCFLRKQGKSSNVAGSHPSLRSALPMQLETADGVCLAGYSVGCTDPNSPTADTALVVMHGFSGSVRKRDVRRVVTGLARYTGVLAVDTRGHGDSEGVTTLGDREVLDVDAAVRAARDLGYRRVVPIGWSMGGSSVLRHAGLRGGSVHGHPVRSQVDAVISVSATSRWFARDTAPMRRVHWLVEGRGGRLLTRHLLRTRVDADGWAEVPLSPVQVVGRIAPTPLLLIHGDRDSYFPLDHPQALRQAAGEPTELWLLPGMGHAESAATPQLLDRIGRHLPTLLDARAAAP